MAFQVSPGVQVQEKDLTNIIPAVATSVGGFAGLAEWGPALEATLVSGETDLVSQFGYPRTSTVAGANNRLDWYSAANFLEYSSALQFVRVLPDGARNAASGAAAAGPAQIEIQVSGTANTTGTINVEYTDGTTVAVAVTNGDTASVVAFNLGIAIAGTGITSVVNTAEYVTYDLDALTTPNSLTVSGLTFDYLETASTITEGNAYASESIVKNYNDFLVVGSSLTDGSVYARYPGSLGNSLAVMIVDAGCTDLSSVTIGTGTATLADYFDDVPATSVWAENLGLPSTFNDEVHVLVYTTDTKLTGTKNEVVESYAFLSKAKNAKTADGAANYYVDAVNAASAYVYLLNEETAATGTVTTTGTSIGSTITDITGLTAMNAFISATSGVLDYSLNGGLDGDAVADADYTEAYDVLNDVETVDVSLLITGTRSKTVQKYVIEIAEDRKDAIAYVSPDYSSSVLNPTAAKVVDYFNNSTDGFNSSSYAVFDSGWKRQYDRYNDEYFWIPLNSDIAGLTAQTEYTNDAWWSPAGLNRGFIKNVVKLSFNPTQADRDTLYPKRVNPVVTFRGQGTLLYGDKTALSRPSAFDRINVRRLFIVLEKAVATAAKYQLFEFNDDLTRRVFVNAVEPFLADIKSRRGIYDFKVVCDTSNNTSEVIDGNRFVADIYIKPARSINFMTLNFVAVRSGVSFSEVAGA